jgi:hypothetical protein
VLPGVLVVRPALGDVVRDDDAGGIPPSTSCTGPTRTSTTRPPGPSTMIGDAVERLTTAGSSAPRSGRAGRRSSRAPPVAGVDAAVDHEAAAGQQHGALRGQTASSAGDAVQGRLQHRQQVLAAVLAERSCGTDPTGPLHSHERLPGLTDPTVEAGRPRGATAVPSASPDPPR